MRSRDWLLRVPAVILILIALAAVFADGLSSYDPAAEHRSKPYHPPTAIHFCDENKDCSFRPFVYETEMSFDENFRRVYRENKDRRFYLSFGWGPLFRVPEPGHIFLLGTDSRGRDLYSRILYGGRVSLSVGVLGACIASFLGLVVGACAGYFGGRTDTLLMRIAEFFIMIPAFYFLLALRGALPAELGSDKVYFLTIGVLSLIGWGGVARVIRGLARSIRQNEFVTASLILGRSHMMIIRDHIIPHTFSYLLVVISISIPSYILMESALSVLGLGIQDPAVSWGSLLGEAVAVAHIRLHPWILMPGVLLFVTAWCFNMIGDHLKREGTAA